MTGDLTRGKVWPTPQLIRAARGLVSIDQETLAAAAGVSRKAVISLEADKSDAMDYRRLDVLQKIRKVLEEKWRIEFVRESQSVGAGVHLRKSSASASWKMALVGEHPYLKAVARDHSVIPSRLPRRIGLPSLSTQEPIPSSAGSRRTEAVGPFDTPRGASPR